MHNMTFENNNNIDRLRQPVSQRTHRLLILPCVDVQCAVECDTETWTRKRLKELCPQGWTYWLQPAPPHHFPPTIWKASKGQLSCNNGLTNNTKALVYGQTQEEGLVRVQDSGTMGSILRKNTFELSSSLTDDDRTSDRTLILEGTMARGRPLLPFTPVPLLLGYLSCVTCYAKNAEMGHQASSLREEGVVHAISTWWWWRWAVFSCFMQGKPHGSHLFLLTIVPEQDGTLEVKPLTYVCSWKRLISRHLCLYVYWRRNERAPSSNDLFLFNSDLSSQSGETLERLSMAAGHTYKPKHWNSLFRTWV